MLRKIFTTMTLAICLIVPISMFLIGCDSDSSIETIQCRVSSVAELQEKLTTAEDGTEIILQENLTVSQPEEFKACFVVSKNVTLNLNSKTIEAKTGTGYNPTVSTTENSLFSSSLISLFTINAGGDLTIIGEGIIDSGIGDLYTFNINGGKLTIKSGTIKGSCSTIQVNCGVAEILGGEFSVHPATNTNDCRYLLNLIDANGKNGSAKIVVYGGKFEKFNPSINLSENPAKDYVPKNYEVKTENDIYTVVEKES